MRPTTIGRPTRATSLLILLLLSCAFALGACGGSGSDESSAGSGSGGASSSGGDDDRGRVRLTECLRKQGIDVPDSPGQGGGGGGGNADQQKIQEAMQGPCKKYQQQAFGNVSEDDRSKLQDQMTKFTSCMRKNGVDIPDATAGQGGPPGGNIDQDDPQVQKATKACRSQLPQGGPGQ